jgi:chromate transporter
LAIVCLTLFFLLLILLPIVKETTSLSWLAIFDSFYRSGSLVFGGGHVVLPLLEREFIPTGLVNKGEFLAGYAATQAVPGPLFTFAAYIGAVISGWKGALFATFAIFLPAFLLIVGALPFWDALRRNTKVNGALLGVNASVVGILAAALYNPIWINTIHTLPDFIFAGILFCMLTYWKLPPWVIVVSGAFGGLLLY